MRPPCRLAPVALVLLASAGGVMAQVVTVTTTADVVDVDWSTATVAELPGPDGQVSLSEALIATNNTPGHQRIAFAIEPSDPGFGFLLPGRAVFTSGTGYSWRSNDPVTIDGTSQTLFGGDTHAAGNEVALYGNALSLNGDGSTLIGFDSSAIGVTGSDSLIEGNTGSMNISLSGGSGSTVPGRGPSLP